MALTIEDLTRISLVSSPEAHPARPEALFTLTKMSTDENKYKTSIWTTGNGKPRPITSGPSDTCPKWSPAGDVFAFTRRSEDRASIMIHGGGEPWELASFKTGVRGLQWMPDGRGLIIQSMAPPGGERFKKYSEREVLVADRIPVWFNGEGWVFDRFPHLFYVEYPGGRVERLTWGETSIVAYDTYSEGVVYAEAYNMLEPRLHRIVRQTLDGEREVLLEGYTVSAIAADGDTVYFRGHKGERGYASHHKIYMINDGRIECITCGMDRNTVNTVNSDIRGPSCSRPLQASNGVVYFQVHDAGRVHVYKWSGGLEPHIAPGDVVVDEYSIAGDTTAYTLMTPTRPKELYINGEKATSFNDWVEARAMEPIKGQVEREGARIDYWILGRADCKRCRPWILYIHGGPKTSYGYAFIHELQALAGMGFTIIYSNPRGSDGYSEEFADIRGKYGTVDYEDLMAVVDKILGERAELDPERGGVTGGSYGGWMTNWIITRTTRFKAAVTQRSCSNWISFYGASDIGWHFAQDQHQAPPPWVDPEPLIEKSPLFSLDKAKTPLLIIHATEDYRCPLEQAIQLFTGLKVLGVEARLAVFPGENHDLSRSGRPKQRLARLRLIAEWMKTHLADQARGEV
ncbi:MAG: S9 family peptidase [Desulfurococcales archaeon]|nr:S9 family peptidase [Desulfurococcales archaeon]